MINEKKYCDDASSWNCCFSRDTKILVKENNKLIEKSIYEIKNDDLILSVINGEKKFVKVKYTKE